MKILKKFCAVALCFSLFLCGSGFSNKYEDVQTIELKSNPTTGFVWNVKVLTHSDDQKDKVLVFANDDDKKGKADSLKENKEDHKDDEEKLNNLTGKKKKGEVEISRIFNIETEDKLICGAGGTDIFTIKGVKEGMVKIKFEYAKGTSNESNENKCDENSICVAEVVIVELHVNKDGKIKIVKYSDHVCKRIF